MDSSSFSDIDKIAAGILKDSKASGVFPTPVDLIVDYVELQVHSGVDLSSVDEGFLAKHKAGLRRILEKVIGILDVRKKVIYLDHKQPDTRKRFVKLHEVGHDALPWQNSTFSFLDDQKNLSLDVKEQYEREASHFASSALFQLNRFEEEAMKLPLSIKSATALAQKFGSSKHAALRRYVEYSSKRCALLVLKKPLTNGHFRAGVRNYFQSPAFAKEFGTITWPHECGTEFRFIQDLKNGRRFYEDGVLTTTSAALESVTLHYHYFCNSYNTFIFLFPPGEAIRSRVEIYGVPA